MSDDYKELLLEDYRRIAEAMGKSEESGESRVNLFMSLTTISVTVMAAILAMNDGEPDDATVRIAALAGLFSLLALGLLILKRLVTRNERTDEAKHRLDLIRQEFKDHFVDDGLLVNYFPPPTKKDSGTKSSFEVRKIGGLADIIALLNSLLCVGIIGIIFGSPLIPLISDHSSFGATLLGVLVWIVALAIVGILFSVQYRVIRNIEGKTHKKVWADQPTHAGGVVFKQGDGRVEYLLVRPKNRTDQWVLPKGHIEEPEGHSKAALREVHEETGLVVQLICLVDRVQFTPSEKPETRVDAKYYLMELQLNTKDSENLSSEGREMCWAPLAEAVQKLTHSDSKYLVQQAENRRLRNEKKQ